MLLAVPLMGTPGLFVKFGGFWDDFGESKSEVDTPMNPCGGATPICKGFIEGSIPLNASPQPL